MGKGSPEVAFNLPEDTQQAPAGSPPAHAQHFCPEGLLLSPFPCFLVLPLHVHPRTPLSYLSHEESCGAEHSSPGTLRLGSGK